MNNEVAAGKGIELYLNNLGYDMEGKSSFVMGSIEFNANVIVATDYGVYLDSPIYEFGEYIYDNLSAVMENFECNGNAIGSGSDSFYVAYCEYVIYHMFDASSFTMGNIAFCDNDIVTAESGIDLKQFDYIGSYMDGTAAFAMGSVLVNDNVIDTVYDGVCVSDLVNFGMEISGDHSSWRTWNPVATPLPQAIGAWKSSSE